MASAPTPAVPPATPDGPAVPILPALDVADTLGFYDRLGFAVEPFDEGYGFAHRDAILLHFIHFADLDPFENIAATFIRVRDADGLHAEFVRRARLWLVPPVITPELDGEARRRFAAGETIARMTADVEDKPWGLREFGLLDPNNNLLRFAQPL